MLQPPNSTEDEESKTEQEVGLQKEEEEEEKHGKGTWKHAAFHVATTIANPRRLCSSAFCSCFSRLASRCK
ncbi:hypothetical protein M0R45_010715 [Rubus argutus]|uniref:Uncharacterized protein n=1 Tax=Rubus argutus TaxID=59490 RepID=A0AAW1Y818_RUBAR